MKVPARTNVPLPDELTFEEGAAVSCGTGTAYGALKRIDVSGRDTLAVFGQGPVGLSATMLGVAMGARVIAVDIAAERLALAKQFGADAHKVEEPNETFTLTLSNPVGFTLARAYGAAGRVAEAVPVYERLAKQRPDVSQTWSAWAGLYPQDVDKRLGVLRRGLAVVPDNPDLAAAIGEELEIAGRFDEAIAHYDKVLAGNPANAGIANNLASVLLDQRTDKASFARALELAKGFGTSTSPAVLDTLGWAQYRNGDFLQAATVLERAVIAADELIAATRARSGDEQSAQLGRQLASLHYHLGMAYLASQNKVGARQELAKALADPKAAFPGIEVARKELARLGP